MGSRSEATAAGGWGFGVKPLAVGTPALKGFNTFLTKVNQFLNYFCLYFSLKKFICLQDKKA